MFGKCYAVVLLERLVMESTIELQIKKVALQSVTIQRPLTNLDKADNKVVDISGK